MSAPQVKITIQQWIKEVNMIAVLTLFLLAVLAFTFSVQQSNGAVELLTVTNTTTTRATSKLHVGAVFVFAVVLQMIGHVVTAFNAKSVETKILNNDKLDSRAGALVVSLPLMHAAVLVGVAQIIDTWAVFANFLVVLLVLVILFIFERGEERSKFVKLLSVFVIGVLYAAFWVLAWASGPRTKARTAQLGGFSFGLFFLIVVYLIVVRTTSKRIRDLKTKKNDGESINEQCYAIMLRREAVYVCITVAFAMISITTWICHTSYDNPTRRTVIAVCISSFLQLLMCFAISHRIQFVAFNKTQLSMINKRLMQESTYVLNANVDVSIDSDSDTEDINLALTRS
jgi:cytochrome bd-type quinol oxidase subunit 2